MVAVFTQMGVLEHQKNDYVVAGFVEIRLTLMFFDLLLSQNERKLQRCQVWSIQSDVVF